MKYIPLKNYWHCYLLYKQLSHFNKIKQVKSKIMTIIDVFEQHNQPNISKILEQYTSYRPSAWVLWIWNVDDNWRELDIMEDAFRFDPIVTNFNEIKGYMQLQDLLLEYITTDARKTINFWPQMEEALEHIFGNLVLSQHWQTEPFASFRSVLKSVRSNRYMTVLFEMWKYRFGVKDLRKLQQSFVNLSEDILSVEALHQTLDPKPYLVKWNRLKKGIISRIWSQPHANEQSIRIMLTFFPVDYRTTASSILPLLLSSLECKRFNSQHPNYHCGTADDFSPCGCNCFCSTMMGTLLANETGLLGTKIHEILSKGHIYLAIGNRYRDWSEYKMNIIQTTARSFKDFEEETTCRQSFQQLTSISPKLYSLQDTLVPNIHEYYLIHTSRILEKTRTPSMKQYLFDFIRDRSTNIFGVDALWEKISPMKHQGQLSERFLQLLQIEFESSTLHELGNEHRYVEEKNRLIRMSWSNDVIWPWFSNVFQIILLANRDDKYFRQVKTILKRIRKHSRFGPESPEFIHQKMIFNNICQQYNPKFMIGKLYDSF